MTHRYKTTGASGGRAADIWVLLDPEQASWLARNVGGSLTVMSRDAEVVRISNVPPDAPQMRLGELA